jgi:hypothetical protein
LAPHQNGIHIALSNIVKIQEKAGPELENFFFFEVLGLELGAFTLSHFFVKGFFQDRVLKTICPGCL